MYVDRNTIFAIDFACFHSPETKDETERARKVGREKANPVLKTQTRNVVDNEFNQRASIPLAIASIVWSEESLD